MPGETAQDSPPQSQQRWKTTDDNGCAYYQRVTGPDGGRLIAELHFGIGDGHVAAAVHHYVEPDGHASADLDGCTPRSSLPARDVYDRWVAAGRGDQAAFELLAEVEVPAVLPPVPAHAQRQIDDLQRQLAAAQAQIARRVQRVDAGRRRSG